MAKQITANNIIVKSTDLSGINQAALKGKYCSEVLDCNGGLNEELTI